VRHPTVVPPAESPEPHVAVPAAGVSLRKERSPAMLKGHLCRVCVLEIAHTISGRQGGAQRSRIQGDAQLQRE
jgi:hypothetical protein